MATCSQCSSDILDGTAARTGGRCRPCASKRVVGEIAMTQFGRSYDEVWQRPRLTTDKYRDCWFQAELQLAGPLFASRTSGDIEYVFRSPDRFDGSQNPSELLAWMSRQVQAVAVCAAARAPSNAAEQSDREHLEVWVRNLGTLLSHWHEFYFARHPNWSGRRTVKT